MRVGGADEDCLHRFLIFGFRPQIKTDLWEGTAIRELWVGLIRSGDHLHRQAELGVWVGKIQAETCDRARPARRDFDFDYSVSILEVREKLVTDQKVRRTVFPGLPSAKVTGRQAVCERGGEGFLSSHPDLNGSDAHARTHIKHNRRHLRIPPYY